MNCGSITFHKAQYEINEQQLTTQLRNCLIKPFYSKKINKYNIVKSAFPTKIRDTTGTVEIVVLNA